MSDNRDLGTWDETFHQSKRPQPIEYTCIHKGECPYRIARQRESEGVVVEIGFVQLAALRISVPPGRYRLTRIQDGDK